MTNFLKTYTESANIKTSSNLVSVSYAGPIFDATANYCLKKGLHYGVCYGYNNTSKR